MRSTLAFMATFVAGASAMPAELILPSQPIVQPGNITVLSVRDFVYGDNGDLVFTGASRVPGGSQIDRIFRLRAGDTEAELIGFSDTSIDGVPTYISFFSGMTDDGSAYLYEDLGETRVLTTGPGVEPPLTSYFNSSTPITGVSGTFSGFNFPKFAHRNPGIVFTARINESNPFVQRVIRSLDGVNEAVLSGNTTYQLDDGPFVAQGVGALLDINNAGMVFSSIGNFDNFPGDERLVAIDLGGNVEEILDLHGPVDGPVPGASIQFYNEQTLRVSDQPSLLFTVSLEGPGITFNSSQAILYSKEGDPLPRVIAQEGFPVNGDPDPITGFGFDPSIAKASGEVLFSVELPGNQDSLFQPRSAYLWGDPDDLQILKAFEPIAGANRVPTVLNVNEPQLSPDGLVAFAVEAYADPINQVGFGSLLLATNAAGSLQVLAESGERVLEFDRDGLFAHWGFMQFIGFSREKAFNSCGQLIVSADVRLLDEDGNFFDTISGLFRFQLFHPDNNCDGVRDLTDIANFVTAFINGEPLADANRDGIFDLVDITAFVTTFNR